MEKMKQLEHQSIDIRPLELKDIQTLVQQFTNTSNQKWQQYYTEHEAGERFVCLITKNNTIVGYGSLLPESSYEPFCQDDVFEIADVFVAERERRQGLATLLISYFESIAQDEEAPYIGIGIGLDALHAPAQALAVHLGFVPDDAGMTYKGAPVHVGQQYTVDDHLKLWFVKDLTVHEHDE